MLALCYSNKSTLIISSALCLRALLLGEEFDADGLEGDAAFRQRLFAAFIGSIDIQSRLLRNSVIATSIGGAMTLAIWAWILAEKML